MDVLKLLELMEEKVPGHSWLLLLGACIAAVLLYKTGETLLPQLIKSIVTLLCGRVEASRQDAQTETNIRNACASTRNVNWIAALPSLAGYNWRPTVMETYFPLALHTADTQTATAAVSLTDVLNRDRFLVITGAAGSGKSTILSFLAVHFANDTVDSGLGLRESRLPICFNLIELDAIPELGPPADLFSELYRRHAMLVGVGFIQRQIESERCVILLDGLDEIGDPEQRRRVLRWINDLVAVHPRTRVVITCRDAEWEAVNVPNTLRVQIMPLTTGDAKRFAETWRARFGDDLSREFTRFIDEIDAAYSFVATNPMLLTLSLILLTQGVMLPRARAQVVELFVRAMLGEWAAIKGSVTQPPAPVAISALQSLAFLALDHSKLHGTIDVTRAPFRAAVEPHANPMGLSGPDWLDPLARRTGLLQRLGNGRYVFSNRRIQEFLAARHLAIRPPGRRIARLWENLDWYETLLFYAELNEHKAEVLDLALTRGNPENTSTALLLLTASAEANLICPEQAARGFAHVRRFITNQLASGDAVESYLFRACLELDGPACLEAAKHMLDSPPLPGAAVAALTQLARSGASTAIVALTEQLPRMPYRHRLVLIGLLPDLPWPDAERLIDSMIDDPAMSEGLRESIPRCGDPAVVYLERVIASLDRVEANRTALATIVAIRHPSVPDFLIEKLREASGLRRAAIKVAFLRNIGIAESDVDQMMIEKLIEGKKSLYQRGGKRLFDVILACLMLVSCSIFLVIISVLIRLDSPGPVIFKQVRLGKDGKPYSQLKFRTMFTRLEEDHLLYAQRSDPRITRLGRFLRRTSVDELPCLLNVLRGNMSIVGPRPEPIRLGTSYHNARLSTITRLRPGLTGNAQLVLYLTGSQNILESRLVYDLAYAINCSLKLDLTIIARTLITTIKTRSAF